MQVCFGGCSVEGFGLVVWITETVTDISYLLRSVHVDKLFTQINICFGIITPWTSRIIMNLSSGLNTLKLK